MRRTVISRLQYTCTCNLHVHVSYMYFELQYITEWYSHMTTNYSHVTTGTDQCECTVYMQYSVHEQ